MRKIYYYTAWCIMLIITSCASVFNAKYQSVSIAINQNEELLVDDEAPKMKDGKVILERTLSPKQIVIKKDGYKPNYKVVTQYRKSPLTLLNLIGGPLALYTIFCDKAPKAYNYAEEYEGGELVKVPEHKKGTKDVFLNKISINLDNQNLKEERYRLSGKMFNDERKMRNITPSSKNQNIANQEDEKISIDNTIFTDVLNDLLANKGYIDTTKRALKSSYINNVYINASINAITFYRIVAMRASKISSTKLLYVNAASNHIYTDLDIEWEVLDYYKNPIYKCTTKTRSGEFAIIDFKKQQDYFLNSTADAIELGLIEFLNKQEVNAILSEQSVVEEEATFSTLIISKPEAYVSNLSEAIQSSVTVVTESGHGSGFAISNDGYIITNYHVISNAKSLKIITNEETEYADVEIVRVSKIHDLALLKIKANGLVPFNISNDKNIEIAKDIYAVGTPSSQDLSQSISKGIISGIRTTDMGSTLIQTDASVNGGNSGGAIVDKQGLVIGIVSAKLKGFGIEGVAFGIPAYEIADKLKVVLE